MTGQERRKAILCLLQNSDKPIKGMEMAGQLGVSRQVIVQDMALLRAANYNIIATTKGYIFLVKGILD